MEEKNFARMDSEHQSVRTHGHNAIIVQMKVISAVPFFNLNAVSDCALLNCPEPNGTRPVARGTRPDDGTRPVGHVAGGTWPISPSWDVGQHTALALSAQGIDALESGVEAEGRKHFSRRPYERQI